MAQALVPLKDLVQAKTRLGGLLRTSERRALAQAMVEDVLAALCSHPLIERITLVSDDPGAHLLANRYGSVCWTEQELGCKGLNPVIAAATARLLRLGPEPLLVLHGDLPLITVEDVDAVLSKQAQIKGLVIACDRAGTGTNLLALDRQCVPEFAFGVDSCHRHEAAARRQGFPVAVLRREGLAMDVDEPADMAALLEALNENSQSRTAKLLYDGGLAERISAALGSLRTGGSEANLVEGLKQE